MSFLHPPDWKSTDLRELYVVIFHQVAARPEAYVTKQVQCLVADNRSSRSRIPD